MESPTNLEELTTGMHTRLHVKTYLLIAIMVVAGPVGNLLIAKAMKQLGQVKFWPVSALLAVFVRAFSSFTIWAGIACLLAFIAAYMLALSMADYSFVQPAAALGYGVVAALGVFVLGEPVSPLHWAGIAVICLGVSFVRNTHPRTTENPH
jgi:drug/metabolite transporter (DMT)-like permease